MPSVSDRSQVARHDHFGAVHAVQLLARLRADLERKNGEGRTAPRLEPDPREGHVGLPQRKPSVQSGKSLWKALAPCALRVVWHVFLGVRNHRYGLGFESVSKELGQIKSRIHGRRPSPATSSFKSDLSPLANLKLL